MREGQIRSFPWNSADFQIPRPAGDRILLASYLAMQDTCGAMNAHATPSKRRRVWKWLVLAASPFVLGFAWIVLGQPGTSGVLDYRKAADGTECLVTQSWNGWLNGEPYTIGFYSREPGKAWVWQYIDHEASRWFRCRMEIEEGRNEVRVYSGTTLQRTLRLHPAPLYAAPAKPPYLPEGLNS